MKMTQMALAWGRASGTERVAGPDPRQARGEKLAMQRTPHRQPWPSVLGLDYCLVSVNLSAESTSPLEAAFFPVTVSRTVWLPVVPKVTLPKVVVG